MKLKVASILFVSAFLLLASCGDSSDDSDKKDASTEQADREKANEIKKLMSVYMGAGARFHLIRFPTFFPIFLNFS